MGKKPVSGLNDYIAAKRETPLLLVIDDDAVVRSMLLKSLQKLGYDVIQAATGPQGLELFRQHRPDLVLLDVMMPVMNGIEVCLEIREMDPARTVPVIILSGSEDVASVDKGFEAGANSFITKPINWSLFSQRVRYVLKSREMYFELRKSRERVSHALRTAMLGYWDWDLQTGKFHIPAGMMDMLGIDRQRNLQFSDLVKYVPQEDSNRVVQAFEDAKNRGTRFVLEHRIIGQDQRERYIFQQCEVLMDENKKPRYVLGTIQDITSLKRAEDMILHQAYHDLLTDLPNQTLFKERLTHALKVAEHARHQVAILAIDIDRFQMINESLGHDIGNELLVAFAGFLNGFIFEGDTASRISGNEFAILLESPASVDSVSQFIKHLKQSLREVAFDLGGEKVFISLSLGVAMYPDDDIDASGLIHCANAAMRKAKSLGGNQEYFYTQDMNRRVDDRLRMESGLREAIEENQLELYYQPQTDTLTRKVLAAEALVRWRHKEYGLVPPIRFIPLAEETGLIHSLGKYVLEHAIKQVAEWERKGYQICVGVNLSARQFMQADLVEQIGDLLQKHQVNPKNLDLEITETVAIQDAENSINKMHKLKSLGVTLSMDDFGTGYSSLSYLHKFPLDVIKIDRSFVKDIIGQKENGAIARAVIAMAHSLNLKVIAEGVETDEQLAFLRQYGCEVIQGYLISKPLPVDEFEKRLLN